MIENKLPPLLFHMSSALLPGTSYYFRAYSLSATGRLSMETLSDNSRISFCAKSSVMAAVSNSIMNSYPDNTFKPQGDASRAESAMVIIFDFFARSVDLRLFRQSESSRFATGGL